jgi:hypothetical protein
VILQGVFGLISFDWFGSGAHRCSYWDSASGHSAYRIGKEHNMPIPAHICKFLDSEGIAYQLCTHSRAYTAQGIAQAQHMSGKRLAKVVIVVADDRRLVMAVVPANCRVDLERLGRLLHTNWIRLSTEEEFKDTFPECELGAMPPLGNIYRLMKCSGLIRPFPSMRERMLRLF